ncbi:MAG: apolipoprotein N-acyltransferase [Pseudomonadota bacterium]
MLDRLYGVADALTLLHGWRRGLTAFASGAMCVLAMPPVFFAPILLLTLPVLVLLLDGADVDPRPNGRWARLRPSSFFWVGFWFGYGYFLAGLYWIAEALLVNPAAHGWLILPALIFIPGGLALFFALPCALARRFWASGSRRVLLLAALLVVFEWLRGWLFTGFPWNGFHSAFGLHEALLQGFALVGPLVASLLVLLVAMLPAALWPRGSGLRGFLVYALSCLVLIGGWTGYGALRLSNATDAVQEAITFRLVQPNIAQADKWDPALRDQHMATLFDLSQRNTGPDQAGLLSVTHLVWPESAFPFLVAERPDVLVALGEMLPLGTHLIAGAVRSEPRARDRVFYNSVYAFNDRGEIADAYDKVRLVPFGERLPFSDLVDRLGLGPLVSAPAGFEAGPGPGVLSSPGAPDGLALVCYEAIFPAFVRAGVRQHRPGYLLNVTNDAWFGASAGPHQHVFQARLRAVEMGLPMVRAANTGVSAIIDGYGRYWARLELGEQGVLDAQLPAALPVTVFARLGNWPCLLLLVLILTWSVYYHRTHGRV